MKKRIIIALGSLLVAVAIILCLPVPAPSPGLDSGSTGPTTGGPTFRPTTTTGSTPTEPGTSGTTTAPIPPTTTTVPAPPTTQPTTVPTQPPTTTPTTAPTQPPTTTPTTAPTTVPPTTQPPTTLPPTTTLPPRPGQVRLYTCDENVLEAYARLAVEYYKTTGIEVILLTPREGETCAQALAGYMACDAPPTVFCIHDEAALKLYADRLYDLKASAVAGKLYSADFGMYSGEKLLALPVEVDWFGYIYNANKLSQAGFSRSDFTGYSAMEYIVKHIRSQYSVLSAHPFGRPGFVDTSDSGLAALLSTVFHDQAQLRSFVDLYLGNSRATTDAIGSFVSSKTVLYAGTTACFEEALKLGVHNLDLLPAFTDGSSAMQYTCDHFWAVEGTGYAPDIAETLTFLNWMVTARTDGAAPIDALGLLSPYKDATVADNALEKQLRTYMAQEKAKLHWTNRCVAAEDHAAFCAALAAYYASPSDTTWAKVKALMNKST